MLVYYAFLSIFFIFSIIDLAKVQGKKYFRPLLLILIIVFAGLRYNTGEDYTGYSKFFEGNLDSNWEPGYVLLNKIFKYLFGNYYVMQFTITFFICTVIYNFIEKYSSYKTISLFIFVSACTKYFLMGAVRHSIAVTIVVLSIKFIFNRKFLSFLLVILLASCFHISAIFAIPLYFLNRRFNKILLIVMMILSILISSKTRILLITFISLIGPFLPGRMSYLAKVYLNSDLIYFSAIRSISTYSYVLTIMAIILLLVVDRNKEDKKYFFLNTLIIAIIIQNITTEFLALSRIAEFYSFFNIITYTYFFKIINFKKSVGMFPFYACCILAFISYPYISFYKNSKIYDITGRPMNYTHVPYYNILYHPYEAQYRKDSGHQ
jgi:hypothetical protein